MYLIFINLILVVTFDSTRQMKIKQDEYKYPASKSPGGPEMDLVLLGGFTTNGLDSKTGEVSTLNPSSLSPSPSKCSFPDLPVPTSSHATARLETGALLSCGGFTGDGLNKTDSCWTSSAGSTTWTSHPPLPHPMAGVTMTSLTTGTVLLAGGWAGQPIAQTWTLSSQGTWISGPDMKTARTAHCAVNWEMAGEDVIIIGGRTLKFGWLSSVESISLDKHITKSLPSLPTAREGHGCATIKREQGPVVVVAGGLGQGNKFLATVEMFEEGSWSSIGSLPGPRFGHVLVALGDSLGLFGGADTDKNPVSTPLVMKTGLMKWQKMDGNVTRYYHNALLVPSCMCLA